MGRLGGDRDLTPEDRIAALEARVQELIEELRQEQQVTVLLRDQMEADYEDRIMEGLEAKWQDYLTKQTFRLPDNHLECLVQEMIRQLPYDRGIYDQIRNMFQEWLRNGHISHMNYNDSMDNRVRRTTIYLPERRFQINTIVEDWIK